MIYAPNVTQPKPVSNDWPIIIY